MTKSKPILCLDFDGVIHSYTSKWVATDIIPDPPTEGFFGWAQEADKVFKLVVYSSRSRTPAGLSAMQTWMHRQTQTWRDKGGFGMIPKFDYAYEKPPAFITIDDRAVRFNGDWSELEPTELIKFKTWNHKARAR